MTTEQTQAKQGINITEKALEHIRGTMQKEGIDPIAGRAAPGRAGRRMLRAFLQHSL